jgi:hypothetical protein
MMSSSSIPLFQETASSVGLGTLLPGFSPSASSVKRKKYSRGRSSSSGSEPTVTPLAKRLRKDHGGVSLVPPSGESATEVLLRLGRQRAQSLKRQITPQQFPVATPVPATPGWDYDPDDEFRNPRNHSPGEDICPLLCREPERVKEAEEHRDTGSLSESSADSEFEPPTPITANPYEAFADRKPLAEMWEGGLGVHHNEGRKDEILNMMENVELDSDTEIRPRNTSLPGSESGSLKKGISRRVTQRARAPLLKTPVKVKAKVAAETGDDNEQTASPQFSLQEKIAAATHRRHGERQVQQCLQRRRGLEDD